MNQLRATLSERHVNMMCFSQSVGIGLFLQNGRAIHYAGPGMATLAYILSGTIIWSAASCLGEMTALFPVKGPIFELTKRFLDQSVGYATAWLTWFGWIMLIAAELVAITHMFKFEYPPELLAQAGYPSSTLSFAPNISPGVLILIFIPFILLFNLVPVKSFGQMEYIFGTTKMMFVCVMIVLNTVIHAWNRADKGHFWTYNQPYSFAAKNITLADGTIVNGGIAQLAGMWEAMTTSIFGLIGIETVAITAAVAVTYLEFYKCVNQAAKGGDDSLDDKDDPEVRSQYDRNSPGYPYKSHGQWLRACYALTDISIFIFGFFVIAYQIKFHGFNPANWRRRVSRELQNPRPLVVKNDFRRGRLNLVDTYNLFTMGNLRAFSRWVWVWLKRVPLPPVPPAVEDYRRSNDGRLYAETGLVPAPSTTGTGRSSRSTTSSLSISSTFFGDELPDLSRTSSAKSTEQLPQFSPTFSLRRLQSISEYNELRGHPPSTLPPTPGSFSPSLSPREWKVPQSYAPPSIVPTLSDSSSTSGDNVSSQTSLLGGLFSRRKRKGTLKPEVRDPLPESLSFAFSGVGNNLTLWLKNGHSFIHIKIASWESKRIDLRQTLPAQDADRTLNIKLIAEGDGWIAAIIYRKRQYLLVMINRSATQYTLWKLDAHLRPMTLAMSRDNKLIAVGYGPVVSVFRFDGNLQRWKAELRMEGFKTPDEVKHQVISFSTDCKYITVSCQRYDKARGRDDDGLHTRVWRCKENMGEGFELEHCRLPTDHIGITSVTFNPELSLATMTAFIDSPYPLFLAPCSSHATPLTSTTLSKRAQSHFKARCAAQSSNPTFTSFLTDTNKLHLVNLKTRAVEEWADLGQFRRRELDPREEVATMSMPGEKTCYVVWKDGAKLMLCTVMARNRAECKDLRWLIDDAGWGD
ncbi:hypothetical protein BLS_007615 [Venturia inaequalis]|uniref:Amino acid permease/ SLC12A domain-containing protein n=2 Tax=Venturia inaequalis TaxID=5025 RepID=A0A8H3U9V6_VENIN|nr:hypothetical protein BLS_007615 [Venturia inaequalis]